MQAKKRWAGYLLIIVCFVLYAIYVLGLFLRIPINSDFATLVLESQDILSGNIFLKDWNLTGLTFYTTDLLYFLIGVFLFGVGNKAYFFAITTMFMCLIVASFCVLNRTGKPTVKEIILFMAIAGFPCVLATNLLRAHTAAAVWVLFSFYFINKFLQKNEITFLFFFASVGVLAMGVMGDPITLIIGCLPIILYCLRRLAANDRFPQKKLLFVVVIAVSAIAFGEFGDFLLQFFGKFNKNSALGRVVFLDFDGFVNQIGLYITSVFGLFGADFMGESIGVKSLFYFLWAVVVLFGFFVIFRNLILFLKGTFVEFIDVVISLSITCISAVYIMTDIAIDLASARYIAWFPAFFGILIVRYIKENFWGKKFWRNKLSLQLPIFLLAGCLLVMALDPINFSIPYSSQDALGSFLVEQGLTEGYAGFWNASHITVSTKGQIKMSAVAINQQGYAGKFVWFCKNEWYETPKNFVIIDQSGWGGIDEKSVLESFGPPRQRLVFNEYVIYVYNESITNKLK